MSFDLAVKAGDFVIKNSDLQTIKGTDKLVQDILKIAMTEAGSNPLQPWYGSLVSKSLIGSYLQIDITVAMAKSQLQNAIENLQNLQSLQVKSGQRVDPSEQISFIKDINVSQNTIDPRIWEVRIIVLNRVFGKVVASFTASNV
jgi:hypothetical protein